MAIFDSISARLGGIAGVGRKTYGAKRGAFKTLSARELNCKGSITVGVNKWTVIGSYTVSPQTRVRVGYGQTGNTGQQIGLLYTKVNASLGTQKHGEIRVAVYDAEDRVKGYIVHSVRTERLDDSASDRGIAFLIPEMGVEAIEDDIIKIEMKPDAAITVDGYDAGGTYPTELLLDVTLYS